MFLNIHIINKRYSNDLKVEKSLNRNKIWHIEEWGEHTV